MNPAFDSLKQKPDEDEDSPPGAPKYNSGPLAIQKPTPAPTPDPKKRTY